MKKSIYLISSSLAQSDLKFVRADNESTEVGYDYFSDQGNGVYVVGDFDVPDYSFNAVSNTETFAVVEVIPKVNGVIQRSFDNFLVWSDNLQGGVYRHNPVTISDMSGRVHRFGDTIFDALTYVPTGSFDGLTFTDYQIPSFKAVKDWASGSISIPNVVYTDTVQAITGQKTCSDFIFDVGNSAISSPKFVIRTSSNPPNGGVSAMSVGYNSSNKPDISFHNSNIVCNGSGSVNRWKIQTTSNQYNNPNAVEQNDFVCRKITDLLYESKGAVGISSKTVIVDPSVTEDASLQYYSTITAAIQGIDESEDLSSTNIWSVKIRQHISSAGYTEDVEIPDYINVIGDGLIYIQGQLTRPVTSGSNDITSVLHNLNFTKSNASHNVERFTAQNCVFNSLGGFDVVLEKSNLRDCEFYGETIVSNDDNKIKNCIGNRAVIWGTNDVVWSYDSIPGATYS